MANVVRHHNRIHLLILGLYTLLAVVLTWPLVRTLGSHVPGSDTWALDEYTFLWNTWWFRYSLFNLGQTPLYSTHTFYPLGISLALYTYNLLNTIVALPMQGLLPLPAISNLTFLLATAFSGYGAFLLFVYLGRNVGLAGRGAPPAGGDAPHPSTALYLAAFLCGAVYGFGSYRMVYAALGHYNLWSTTWIPFYTLYLIKTIRQPQRRNAVLAGVFLALILWNEMMLAVFVGILSLVLVLVLGGSGSRLPSRPGQARTTPAGTASRDDSAAPAAPTPAGAPGGDGVATPAGGRRMAGGWPGLLLRLGIVAAVALLLYLPVLVPVLREIGEGYELAGWGDAEKLSVDLLGLITPTALHPLGGDWAETLRQTREGTSRFRDVNTVYLGWAGLTLALVAVVAYGRRLAVWIASLVILTLFGLGPLLQVNGRSQFDLDGLVTSVPLPFILLHYLPVIKANRVPNRFSVTLMLALAVLAGFGAYWLLTRLRRGRALPAAAGLLLVGLVLFDHWSVPLPLTDARFPPAYDQVAADGRDCAVLQLPLGWRNGFGVQGAESTQTQYYQAYHHKRLLSGNTSRNPPFKFDYFRRVPILESLIALQTYGEVETARREADRATAGEFVGFYDICYVAVAPGIPDRPPYVDTREAAVAYVEEVLPVEKVYEQDGWILYQVPSSPLTGTLTVDFGSEAPLAAMAQGEGWAGAEQIQGRTANWAVDQPARLYLPAGQGGDYALEVAAMPFDYPGAAEQQVRPTVNGHRLEPQAMAPGWGSYRWAVPGAALRPGLNEVVFEFERMDAPSEVLPGNGAIGGTGVQAPAAIEVNSGGPADFAYITVGSGDQAEDGSVHQAGYNAAALDPRTGRVLERVGFDTTPGGSEAQAEALADWIARLPAGRIVALAMQGDGTARLTDAAVAALGTIGGGLDPRGNSGWSHAIIGVKGAAPGTALEVAGPGNGWQRVAPDQRTLAMAVDAVTWEPLGP